MNPWRPLIGLPSPLWVLFAATLVNRAGWMAMPFLTLYLTRELGRSPAEAGAALAVAGVGAISTSPVAGHLADRYGARVVMIASLLCTAATLMAFPLARGLPAVLVASGLLGASLELFRPANLAVIAAAAGPERRQDAFAAIRLATSLGMSVGPALGGVLAAVSFRLLFAVDAATTLLAACLLAAAFLPRVDSAAPASSMSGGVSEALAPLTDPRLRLFLVAVLLVMLVFAQHFSTLSLYVVHHLGLREETYGLTFSLNMLLVVVLQVPLTAATSRWPHRRALALGATACGIGFASTGLVASTAGLLATVVVWTAAEMILLPAMADRAAALAPPERLGATMGLYSMTFNAAFGLGPWLGAAILERLGDAALWSACLACALAAAAVFAGATESAPARRSMPR